MNIVNVGLSGGHHMGVCEKGGGVLGCVCQSEIQAFLPALLLSKLLNLIL